MGAAAGDDRARRPLGMLREQAVDARPEAAVARQQAGEVGAAQQVGELQGLAVRRELRQVLAAHHHVDLAREHRRMERGEVQPLQPLGRAHVQHGTDRLALAHLGLETRQAQLDELVAVLRHALDEQPQEAVDLAVAEILDALRRPLVAVGEVRRHVLHQPAQHGRRGGDGRCRSRCRARRRRLRGGAGRRQDRPGGDQSPSTHSTLAPRRVMFSANCGCARRTGVALRMTDLPGMLAATISSAIATRMM